MIGKILETNNKNMDGEDLLVEPDTKLKALVVQSGLLLNYGIMCLQSVYFNSNLNWHNFVMDDVSCNEIRLFLCNKRKMGKDKNVFTVCN